MKGKVFENIKNFAIGAGNKIKNGVTLLVNELANNSNILKEQNNEPADYYKAVEAIVQSDMLDSYKQEMVKTLKQNANSSYYEAVISIINSDMLDSQIVKMVKTIS